MPRPYQQSCRRCRFLKVPLDQSGRRRVQGDMSYECSVAYPKIASCFTTYAPLIKRRMYPYDGAECSMFERLA